MRKFNNGFKQLRNQVAHSDAFEDKELFPIRDYYYLIGETESKELKKFDHFYKRQADNYVQNKKKELKMLADEVTELITLYFDALLPFVDKKIKTNHNKI